MDTNFYLISCNFLSADPTTVQSKTARRREAKFQLKTNCQCTRAATRFLRHPPRCPSCIARHNSRPMIADVRRLRYARHATKRVSTVLRLGGANVECAVNRLVSLYSGLVLSLNHIAILVFDVASAETLTRELASRFDTGQVAGRRFISTDCDDFTYVRLTEAR